VHFIAGIKKQKRQIILSAIW